MIKVFIFVFNRPDILEYQILSLKKYIKNNFLITIVYDRHDGKYDEEFQNICNTYNLNLIKHEAEGNKTPSEYHAMSVDFIFTNFINDGDIVLFLDHDMFAIENIDLLKILSENDVVGLYQNRGTIRYVWPGILLFKYDSLKNINFNFLPTIHNGQHLDTGGGTYKLFDQKLKIKDSGVEYPDFYNNYPLDNFDHPPELHLSQKFLHMRNACHWHNNYKITDDKKTKIIFEILTDIFEKK